MGRYRLDRCVGAGAFATVWQGYDPELDAPVAVKVLADNWVRNADVRERFLSEARLLHRIESRRVVRVHDVGVADERPYFVMDYLAGGTLADLLGGVQRDEAVRLAAEAAEAVHVLHEAGVLHRDIKPSNLLLDRTSEPVRVLVADLGSAKKLADASGYTVTTGTPAYMAPEQADGTGPFDRRADVYSLAVLTWELLTGNRPLLAVPRSGGRRSGSRPPRGELVTGSVEVSPRLVEVLAAALDPDPDGRPRDAHAFARALVAASGSDDAGRSASWSTGPVWAVALAVFVLTALLGWLLL